MSGTCTKVSVVPQKPSPLPDFTRWPSFPFEGDMRVKELADPVAVEPPRSGEDAADCIACNTPDDAYIWVSERWRVRAMDRPTGLPMVLILECRSHFDLGDLPNLLAAELGVMTVRLERAVRSLDGVARVHVNRWGDGSAHLHMWFLARPYGRLQLRGTFLSLWDDILPTIPEQQWRENLALVAAWLAEFGGQANAEPAHIQWQSPLTFSVDASFADSALDAAPDDASEPEGQAQSSTEYGVAAQPVVVEPDGTAKALGGAGTEGAMGTTLGTDPAGTGEATDAARTDAGGEVERGTDPGGSAARDRVDNARVDPNADTRAGVTGGDAPSVTSTETGAGSLAVSDEVGRTAARRPTSLSDIDRTSPGGARNAGTNGGAAGTGAAMSGDTTRTPSVPQQATGGAPINIALTRTEQRPW